MANSPRPIRTDDQLRGAAVHVNYEIKMLIFARGLLSPIWSSPSSHPHENELNMALEAFLLHFRNLRAFLCPKLQPIKEDDIIASDFFGATEAADVVPSAPFEEEKQRIDKMLAHISYRRDRYILDGQDDWTVHDLASLMLAQIDIFLSSLPATRAEWFRRAVT